MLMNVMIEVQLLLNNDLNSGNCIILFIETARMLADDFQRTDPKNYIACHDTHIFKKKIKNKKRDKKNKIRKTKF